MRDRSSLRFIQFYSNAVYTLAAFVQTEDALHFDSIGIILILLVLSTFAVALGFQALDLITGSHAPYNSSCFPWSGISDLPEHVSDNNRYTL